MNIAPLAVHLILAIVFMMAGSIKLKKDEEELAEKMGWVEGFSHSTIRIRGILEPSAMHIALLDDQASPRAVASVSPLRPEEWRNVDHGHVAFGRRPGQRPHPARSVPAGLS